MPPVDHPRGCGENRLMRLNGSNRNGSPPRMRGKLHSPPSRQRISGITPADAGKTPVKGSNRNNYWDHPRGCGENYQNHLKPHPQEGSPPRMRGKHYPNFINKRSNRITPADAGKTYRHGSLTANPKDHPRGCGENGICPAGKNCHYGSPPRMRGKPPSKTHTIKLTGITPADAGKTLMRGCKRRLTTDHPRGCGENTKKIL